MRLEQAVFFSGNLTKIVIAPDDLTGIHPEDHHGQREIDHGMLGCVIHRKGQIFHIFADLGCPALAAAMIIEIDQTHQQQLAKACNPMDFDPGEGHEQKHHHKGQAGTRFYHS